VNLLVIVGNGVKACKRQPASTLSSAMCPLRIKLRGGLDATICPLNDQKNVQIAATCMKTILQICKRSFNPQEKFAVEIVLNHEKVSLVYVQPTPLSFSTEERMHKIRDALQSDLASFVDDSLFLVYNGTAYFPFSKNGRLLKEAIITHTQPSILALLNPSGDVEK
jgi:hypothetical protein